MNLISMSSGGNAKGGGLVRAILSDVNRGFTARALTRNVNSDKATELAKLGADVVAADLDEIESLKRAFEGAYGAFCVTNFWEHFSPEKELASVGRGLAERFVQRRTSSPSFLVRACRSNAPTLLPTISSTIASRVVSATAFVITLRPFRITVTRSEIRRISSILCET
jgi:NmrA-like family protein